MSNAKTHLGVVFCWGVHWCRRTPGSCCWAQMESSTRSKNPQSFPHPSCWFGFKTQENAECLLSWIFLNLHFCNDHSPVSSLSALPFPRQNALALQGHPYVCSFQVCHRRRKTDTTHIYGRLGTDTWKMFSWSHSEASLECLNNSLLYSNPRGSYDALICNIRSPQHCSTAIMPDQSHKAQNCHHCMHCYGNYLHFS